MAAYIPVPRDLTRVKTKVFLNLTKRQLICFGLAALIGVPSFFFIKSIGSTSLAAMSMIIISLRKKGMIILYTCMLNMRISLMIDFPII